MHSYFTFNERRNWSLRGYIRTTKADAGEFRQHLVNLAGLKRLDRATHEHILKLIEYYDVDAEVSDGGKSLVSFPIYCFIRLQSL